MAHAVRSAEADAGSVRTGVIYMAVNIFNWKCYVGQTVNFQKRKRDHLKHEVNTDTKFQRAIRKWGVGAFLWVILEQGIPMDDLPQREEAWVAIYDSYRNGYNSTPGGEVSPMKNPETRAKCL